MIDAIRFVQDGRVETVRDIDPTMTVLQYLRTVTLKRGTKEGCAEGDCGACTVVLGELDGNHIRYRAVNSCIMFLPMLDGKQVITVEDLRMPGGELHPVQRAMVESHGSQCGFCTPGFVMSLFALYQQDGEFSHARINDVLAGNLCRCTGYRPIVAAASKMRDSGGTDQFSAAEEYTVNMLRSIQRDATLTLEHDGHRYVAPASIAGLADELLQFPGAHLVAGGTDVGLWVTKQHRDLDTVISVDGVRDLKGIAVTRDAIEIGSGATYTDALPVLMDHYPEFAELIRRLGSAQIRNSGTIGGNIANGSPIGDSMPALIALDSTLVLRLGDESRDLPLGEFYLGYRQTVLQPGEFVERIRIPIHGRRRHVHTYKVSKRFDQDISAVCGAYFLQLDGNRVQDIRICYGGMAATPQRAKECERALQGAEWTQSSVEAAMSALDRDYNPIGDMRATGEYRGQVARNLLLRFYLETTGAATETQVLSYGR